MRQRLVIIVTLIVVIAALVLINAASYVKVEQIADSEMSPDRSTLNAGATGTRALYDFLHESGYPVARWRESTASLLSFTGPKPSTIIIVGSTIVPISDPEIKELLHWVETGGRLVIIDRSPDPALLPASGNWSIGTHMTSFPWTDVDASNFEQMTSGVKPVPPSQMALLAREVKEVLPSRFAGTITVATTTSKKKDQHGNGDTETSPDESEPTQKPTSNDETKNVSPAPVVNFAREGGGLLVEYPHGKGRIVLLSDPFIVANNGISRADNLELAVNIVTGKGGLVAFDEFHQGRSATHNALIQYFDGTPVLAICGQLALIGLMVIWSRGSRFGRPLPLPQVDRRSSLEFVASMAELQQRARAHDLALENIYGRIRRVLVRHAGLNQSSPRAEVATRVAARSGINRQKLETLMRNCEDAINGAPTNAKESLRMVRQLRQIESALGLRARDRDTKQAAEKADL
ncbi:MAG: hypothetical protein QOH71_3149 [Blastocatellia bacterium]|jgi:hypothetical protein|nr:hypothetical protein [Blastocatellia bacterium]